MDSSKSQDLQIVYRLRREAGAVSWRIIRSDCYTPTGLYNLGILPLVRHVGGYLVKFLNRISHDN